MQAADYLAERLAQYDDMIQALATDRSAQSCGTIAATTMLQCGLLGAVPLIQGDLRSGCAIQQPLEMEAGKLIIGVLANMRREGRHCAGVAGFQLGERL
jgi:hypothetical protein